jgi:hypothetical protein
VHSSPKNDAGARMDWEDLDVPTMTITDGLLFIIFALGFVIGLFWYKPGYFASLAAAFVWAGPKIWSGEKQHGPSTMDTIMRAVERFNRK